MKSTWSPLSPAQNQSKRTVCTELCWWEKNSTVHSEGWAATQSVTLQPVYKGYTVLWLLTKWSCPHSSHVMTLPPAALCRVGTEPSSTTCKRCGVPLHMGFALSCAQAPVVALHWGSTETPIPTNECHSYWAPNISTSTHIFGIAFSLDSYFHTGHTQHTLLQWQLWFMHFWLSGTSLPCLVFQKMLHRCLKKNSICRCTN